MSFEKQDDLINLFDALRYLPAEKRAPILSEARLLDGDFPDFCREVLAYASDDHVDETIAENFEDLLEDYIEQHFGSLRSGAQKSILIAILKKYDALEVTELNEILQAAGLVWFKIEIK